MKILAIDYGRQKIGLATSESKLAQPWKVIHTNNPLDEVRKILSQNNFDKVVVGVSSGQMAEEQETFANQINAETVDETLTTKEAQELSIQSGVGRKKRQNMEDAYAAALILQVYLDKES